MVRAETATMAKPRPAPNASVTTPSAGGRTRSPYRPMAATTRAIANRIHRHPAGKLCARPGAAETPTSTRPAAATTSANQPVRAIRTPMAAEMTAVTATLQANTDCTRNNGRCRKANAAQRKPPMSMTTPVQYRG